jgi:hypothetical protein
VCSLFETCNHSIHARMIELYLLNVRIVRQPKRLKNWDFGSPSLVVQDTISSSRGGTVREAMDNVKFFRDEHKSTIGDVGLLLGTQEGGPTALSHLGPTIN